MTGQMWVVPTALLRYCAAIGASAAALLLAGALHPALEVSPFPIFLAAVTFSAWYGGMGPGLVATVLGVSALDFLFFAPTFTLTVHYWSDAVNLAVFAVVAVVISSLNARLRAARQRADGLRAEAEKLAAERAAILGQIADGVVIADRAGRVVFANEATRRLHAWTAADGHLARYPDRAGFTRGDGRACGQEEVPLARAIRGQAAVNTELRIVRPDGSEVAVEASATPVIGDDGAQLGAVMMLHDVTAQRDLERQKDEFLANVSHDLRTPLTAVKHSIEVVLANEPAGTPEPLHELLLNASQAADRMAALVDDLLELTRLRAGKVRIAPADCDLRELATRAVRAIEPLARSRGQRLELDLPPEPVVVLADPVRLERALVNLIGNAHKYGRADGAVRVAVAARRGEVVVSVGDDGPGIPATEHGRIFERFYRADTEATRQHQGSGLGLPIARALVELHGGRIWVESTAGAGATFWVALPDPRAGNRSRSVASVPA